jgi:hypothetical protein
VIPPEQQVIVNAVAKKTAEMLWTYVQYNESRMNDFMENIRESMQGGSQRTPASSANSSSTLGLGAVLGSTPQPSATPTSTISGDVTTRIGTRRELIPNGSGNYFNVERGKNCFISTCIIGFSEISRIQNAADGSLGEGHERGLSRLQVAM